MRACSRKVLLFMALLFYCQEMYGICIVESMVRCYENVVACF